MALVAAIPSTNHHAIPEPRVFNSSAEINDSLFADAIVQMALGLILGSAAVAAALAFGLGGRDAAARTLERWADVGPPARPAPPKRIRSNPSSDDQPPLV